MIGRVLRQRYELVHILGEGGMGVVYEAHDRTTGGRVAVKVMELSGGNRSKHMVPRFQREAAAAMSLDSPHVTRVFEHGAEGEMLFLVMEYLDGEDLQHVLTRTRVLPAKVALKIAAQACMGLAHAHSRGVIHRDIKPANLFLARAEDGTVTVKVLDFGIAKLRMEEARVGEGADLTRTGALLGSPQYMSPEQARGSRKIDERTDLWSLGVVLYRALGGHTPHEEVEGLGELIMAICNDAPKPLSMLSSSVSSEVATLVSRALKLDPAERFLTAKAMLDEIERLLPEGSRLAKEEVFAPAAAGPKSDEPTNVATTERVVVISHPSIETPGIGMTTTISVHEDPPQATRPSRPERLTTTERSRVSNPPSQKWRGAGWIAAAVGLVAGMTAGVFMLSRSGDKGAPGPASSASAPSATASASVPVSGAARSVADLPDPERCSAPATAAYREGLRALRGGRWDDAHVAFERAAKEDSSCAEAWLRLVITGPARYSVDQIRQTYSKALDLRGSLRERDRLYLEAFEPVVRRDPPDSKELALRLRKLSERFPDDAEIVYMASYHAGYDAADLTFKIDAAKRAISLDPDYSDAWQQLGEALDKAGRRDEAVSALEQCMRVAPSSSDCAEERIGVLSRAGLCQEAMADTRKWLALAPDSANGYRNFAGTLLGTGSADATVEEALTQGWSHLSPEARRRKEPYDRAQLAVLHGDFRSAEKQAREVLHEVESNPDLGLRSSPTMLLIETLLETNDRRAAGALASDFLDRTAVLSANLTRDVAARSQFFLEPLLLDAIRRAGTGKGVDVKARRDAWLEAAERGGLLSDNVRWALSYALLASTPEEAAEAIQHIPPSLLSSGGDLRSPIAPLGGAYVGRALLLADRVDDALNFLRFAAASCDPLRDPFVHTRVHLWLGQALAKKADQAGACKALGVVLKRWGSASPPSVTATAARSLASTLRCAP